MATAMVRPSAKELDKISLELVQISSKLICANTTNYFEAEHNITYSTYQDIDALVFNLQGLLECSTVSLSV